MAMQETATKAAAETTYGAAALSVLKLSGGR